MTRPRMSARSIATRPSRSRIGSRGTATATVYAVARSFGRTYHTGTGDAS